ncbi:MAG TPA: ATP-binding protein [Candidatus Saccharimonadia bacterium]|nr:ATP-binding protein [Candidatus Saccharimonadia bacterium]
MTKKSSTSKATPPTSAREVSVRDTARLEALFTSIGEGIISTDEHGTINRINHAALELFGLRRSEAMHKRLMDVIVPIHENGSFIDPFELPVSKAFQTGSSVGVRMLYRLKDGSTLPVYTTASPIISHGKPIGIIEVFRDLTTEIENEKLQTDFISIASHQLRTPLTAINMYAQMLQDGLAGDLTPEQEPYIEIVLTSVKRMNTLISTLLNITRLEAGGLAIKQQMVNVNDLVNEILTEFAPAAQAKSIALISRLPVDPDPAYIDGLLVKEICANLLSNAIKYTPEGGNVSLTFIETSKELTWSITDTGYGIPANDQRSIFLKFFRASNILHRDVSGTGLGLYLIKNIAESMGGELWFESIEDVGSTFYFSLPKEPVET